MNRLQDENLHPVARLGHWEESFYFNWSDPQADAFGFARISYDRERGTADGVVITIRNGKPELLYPGVRRHVAAPKDGEPLRVLGLSFTMAEPYKRWHLQLEGADTINLEWTALSPVADVRDMPIVVPDDVDFDHYEQSGTVTGTIKVRGKSYRIDGTGHRDHSWGWRDWSAITGWNWIVGQSGTDLTFNMTQVEFRGITYLAGFVYADGEMSLVSSAEFEYQMAPGQDHTPTGARLTLQCADGSVAEIDGTVCGQFPLVKNGLFIQESPAEFTVAYRGENYRARGVIEHTFHVGTRGTIRRIPQLAEMVLRTAPWRVVR